MGSAAFATIAAAAVVECRGETRGTVGQRLTEVLHRDRLPKTTFPVWSPPIWARREKQQGLHLKAHVPPPDPLSFQARLLPQLNRSLAKGCLVVTFLVRIHTASYNNRGARAFLVHCHSICQIIWDRVSRASEVRGMYYRGELKSEIPRRGRWGRQIREVCFFRGTIGGDQSWIRAIRGQQRWWGERGSGWWIGWRGWVRRSIIISWCQYEPQASRVGIERTTHAATVVSSASNRLTSLMGGKIPANDWGRVVRVMMLVLQLKQGEGGEGECWGAFL